MNCPKFGRPFSDKLFGQVSDNFWINHRPLFFTWAVSEYCTKNLFNSLEKK